MPGDAGFSTGLEFCRRATEQQLIHSRRVLLWSFGPILLAIGTLVLGMASAASIFPKGLPLIALAVVWIATYLFIRARQERDLQRELDELNEIDKGTN